MLFDTDWLSTIFTTFNAQAKSNLMISEVVTDSRLKTEHGLFIPLTGEKFDGHDHVKQAIENGSAAIIWNEDIQLPSYIPNDFPVFYVADTLTALQQLAMHYRKKIRPIVIGITGSNGKTTTKDLVASIAKTTYHTHATKGNFNNHIGMPLTILSMDKHTEVLVLEMGMNDFHEIEKLSEIAEPDYAIITNIGESHIEFLGSREGISKAKLEIMHGLKEDGMMIIDGDEPLLAPCHQLSSVLTCGFGEQNDFVITGVELTCRETVFTVGESLQYTIPLLGKHHAQNAAYAIAVGKKLQISDEKIKKGLTSLTLTGMRFEIIKGKNNVSIINDAYNASPTSMVAAINVVKQMKNFKVKVLVLGDIFELGKQSSLFHKSVADVIKPPIHVLFTYGSAAADISKTVSKHQLDVVSHHFETKGELLESLNEYMRPDAIILFKASRGMKFETMIEKIASTGN